MDCLAGQTGDQTKWVNKQAGLRWTKNGEMWEGGQSKKLKAQAWVALCHLISAEKSTAKSNKCNARVKLDQVDRIHTFFTAVNFTNNIPSALVWPCQYIVITSFSLC